MLGAGRRRRAVGHRGGRPKQGNGPRAARRGGRRGGAARRGGGGAAATLAVAGGRWRFVPFAHAGSNMTLSQGGAVATKRATRWSNAVAAADESLSAGVHCWELEITKGGSINVGVCKADVRPESETEYLYNQQGKAWFMNAYYGSLAPGFKDPAGQVPVGARLGCKLDLGAGTLTFYLNGVKHGPGWTGIVGPVKRCVELYSEGYSVTLVRTEPAFRD